MVMTMMCRKQFSSQAMLFFHLNFVHGIRRWTVESMVKRGKFNVAKMEAEEKLEQEVEVCVQVGLIKFSL